MTRSILLSFFMAIICNFYVEIWNCFSVESIARTINCSCDIVLIEKFLFFLLHMSSWEWWLNLWKGSYFHWILCQQCFIQWSKSTVLLTFRKSSRMYWYSNLFLVLFALDLVNERVGWLGGGCLWEILYYTT